ncbi:MAG: hypothetical protein K5669_00520 [Lachnospiraceae bacterium]|nr:hypothetical protein [Lachnospiraceae bacterium]
MKRIGIIVLILVLGMLFFTGCARKNGYEVVITLKSQLDDNEVNQVISQIREELENLSQEVEVYSKDEARIIVDISCTMDETAIKEKIEDSLWSPELYFISETAEDGSLNYSKTGENEWQFDKSIEELIDTGAVVLQGKDIESAGQTVISDINRNVSYAVHLTLTEEGRYKFEDATERAMEKGETIAIYFDGEILYAPAVNETITTGEAQILGLTQEEVAKIVSVLGRGYSRPKVDYEITKCVKKKFW